MNLEQLFNSDVETVKLRLIVIFGQTNQYRVKGIFAGERWQLLEDRSAMVEVTQAEIDRLCQANGWVQDQPSRVSTMDFIYPFKRNDGQHAYRLTSRSTEQGQARKLRNMAEVDYGAASPSVDMNWTSAADAISYGVRVGAYMTQEEAKRAYFALRSQVNPTTAAQMFTPWLAQCNELTMQSVF